jgi:beta-lactamase regulating signal transducer with metallopeptidase domain
MTDALLLWPLAYLVHSTLLLGAAFVATRWIRHAVSAEMLWRCAFFGAFVTASLQPLAQAWTIATAPQARTPAPASARADARVTPARVQAPEAPARAAAPVSRAQQTAPARFARSWWLPTQLRLALLAAAAAWAAIAVAGLLWIAVQWAALARAVGRLRPNADADWTRSSADLARHYGLARTPALRVGARWASPLIGPGRVVCLPDWCLAQLQGAQRDAVLAHELAHLARHDPAWRVASRVAACVGWMQPLNALALRRLDALAEQACDARAARAIADRHAVAEALYACARELRAGRRSPRLQVGMAATSSPLLRRIEQLVRHDPAREAPGPSRRTWALLALVVVGVAFLLPALKVRGGELRPSQWRQLLQDALPDANTHVAMRSPGDDVDLWIRGHATLREDSDELKTGQVTLRETTDGVTRRLVVEPSGGDTLLRHYQVDGEPHAFDAEGKRWAERRWQMVIDALVKPSQRVDRLLQRGGPEAVMQAIENPVDIGTQHVLVEAWAGQRTLDEGTVQRLITAVDRAEPAGDDHDRVLSLRDIARRQQLSPDQKLQLLGALASRGHDSDSTAALQALLVQLDARTQAETIAATAAALRALPSDEARREALSRALDAGTATAPELALQLTPTFTSDHDHRELLEHVARRLGAMDNREMVARYADSARRLGSSNDRRNALTALVDAVPLQKDGCLAVLEALQGMDNNGDLTAVLLALARRMSNDPELVARYRQVARVLPPFERGQVEQALDALPQSG